MEAQVQGYLENPEAAKYLRNIADFLDGPHGRGTKLVAHVELRTPVGPTAQQIKDGMLDEQWRRTTLDMETIG